MNDKPIVKRYEGNPILTRADVPYKVETVHNAGVVRHGGKYVMLFRSHLDTGRSIIGIADSEDGFKWAVRPEPFMTPAKEGVFAEYEAFGVEDPRITLWMGRTTSPQEAYSRLGCGSGWHGPRISKRWSGGVHYAGGLPQHRDLSGADQGRTTGPAHSDISPWSIWIVIQGSAVLGWSRVTGGAVSLGEMKIGPGRRRSDAARWLNIYHGVFPTMDGSVWLRCAHKLDDRRRLRWGPVDFGGGPVGAGGVCTTWCSRAAVPEDDGTLKLYWRRIR